MIRQSEFAEKFIVRFVAQFLECREVRRTVSEASGAVNHRLDIRCRSDALVKPCHALARRVHQTSDGGGTINVLQICVAQATSPQYTQRVHCLRARRRKSLDVLSDGEVVLYIHAQHLQSATATDLYCVGWGVKLYSLTHLTGSQRT